MVCVTHLNPYDSGQGVTSFNNTPELKVPSAFLPSMPKKIGAPSHCS